MKSLAQRPAGRSPVRAGPRCCRLCSSHLDFVSQISFIPHPLPLDLHVHPHPPTANTHTTRHIHNTAHTAPMPASCMPQLSVREQASFSVLVGRSHFIGTGGLSAMYKTQPTMSREARSRHPCAPRCGRYSAAEPGHVSHRIAPRRIPACFRGHPLPPGLELSPVAKTASGLASFGPGLL